MLSNFLSRVMIIVQLIVKWVEERVKGWTKPATKRLIGGTAADLVKSKPELIVEYAFLRQQLIVLKRQVAQPKRTAQDRGRLVALARLEERLANCETQDLVKVAWSGVQALLAAQVERRGTPAENFERNHCLDQTDRR
ncbi:MAG: hypothetical protein ABI947_13095 [Chloroflexota bacterium]